MPRKRVTMPAKLFLVELGKSWLLSFCRKINIKIMEKTKVAIYTRVSSEEQVKGYSLDLQEEKLLAFCKIQDYEVIREHIFREEGESGAKKNRTQLDRLMQAAKNREFSLVLVFKLDRFSRNLKNLLELVSELEESGVSFKSVTETFDTSTPMGKYMLQNMGSIAELEREMIRERMVGGQIKAKQAGNYAGQAPYGYNLNKEKHRLEINTAEAKIIKKMYHWLVDDRDSLFKIQTKLNTLGIPTKYDNLGRKKAINGEGFWKKRVIGRILSNEVYTGEFTFNKTLQGYHKKLKRYEGMQYRPEEEWITVKTPVIISKELFNLAQEQLNKNREFSQRNIKKEYLLNGLLECGLCGGKYGASYDSTRKHSEENHKKRYYCNNSRLGVRKDKCKTPSITENRLEEPIWEKLVHTLSDPRLALEQLEKIQKKKQQESGVEEKIKDLTMLIEKKVASVEKLLDLYINDKIDKASYENRAIKLKEELTSYENELKRNQHQHITEKEKALRINSIKSMYEQFSNNLKDINFMDKKEILKMIVKKAVIKENDITIHCNIPYNLAFAGQSTHFLCRCLQDLR